MSDGEKYEVKCLSVINNTYDFDSKIMTAENVDEMKRMELAMMERTKKGYYRCKILHSQLYDEFIIANEKHCTPDMLRMLQHEMLTQNNKENHNAVASIAPKIKTFSKSSSLLTMVCIVVATQIVGNHKSCERIFANFGLHLDANLARHFRKKTKQRVGDKSNKK